MNFTDAEVSNYYAVRLPQLQQRGREWRGKCPVHNGHDDNFSVHAKTGFANCHSQCGKGWDILSLEEALQGLDFPAAKKSVFQILGRSDDELYANRLEATYEYYDAAGSAVFRTLRWKKANGDKTFTQEKWAATKWIPGMAGVKLVPYNLPSVVKSSLVWIAEGERSVDALRGIGLVGSCNNGGAGNFHDSIITFFAGKKIAILADNDEPGRKHALKIAPMLRTVASSVRIVELPGLPPKGDIVDFLSLGGTKEEVLAAYEKSSEWTPDWDFSISLPHENDKYIRTYVQAIEEAGGFSAFWDFTKQEGIPTPWASLTESMAGGFRNGEVYVIGANTGAGKTSLALQFATHALRQGHGTVIFSMEMSWRDCFHRMVSIEARVDLLDFRYLQKHPNYRREECAAMRQRIQSVSAEMGNFPLYVSNKGSVTPSHVVGEVVRLKKRDGIAFAVLDHMQLMSGDEKSRGDVEKFTAISRATKQAAVEAGIPIILVSQTNRESSRRPSGKPEMSDLRGAGAIEEDACTVFMLYPDKEDAERCILNDTFTKGPVKSWLEASKQRYGLQNMVMPLMHSKKYTRFDPFDGFTREEF